MTGFSILVTFTVALLSGLGVGSAGLLVLFLTLVQQMPQLQAQGVNLLFFLFSSGAALFVHLFRTPPIWGLLLWLIPAGLLGALGGTALALYLPQALLRKLFGWLLIVSGTLGLFAKGSK
jgi:uncharacterized membrane protein YfcA